MNEPANFDTNKPKPWNWPPNKPGKELSFRYQIKLKK